MKARHLAALSALLLMLAACGGSDGADTATIRAVLAASPTTYLHYGARTWGMTPHVGVRIRVSGDRASAVLSTRAGTQRITLQRLAGTWQIHSAQPVVIKGPRVQRPATPSELAALSTVARRVVFHGRDSCVRYHAQISTLDSRYAGVQYSIHEPLRDCLAGDGVSIFARGSSGWRHLEDASEPFVCNSAPPGVVRSLYGVCFVVR